MCRRGRALRQDMLAECSEPNVHCYPQNPERGRICAGAQRDPLDVQTKPHFAHHQVDRLPYIDHDLKCRSQSLLIRRSASLRR